MYELRIRTPEGVLSLPVPAGERLYDALLRAGVPFSAPCGGAHRCGACRIRACGALSPRTEAERGLPAGERLACEARVFGDCEVSLAPPALTAEVGGLLPLPGEPDAPEGALGAAVDVGTTTVAAYLFSLRDGRCLARRGEACALLPFGADVISRLSHTLSAPDGAERQHRALTDQLSGLLASLCVELGAPTSAVRRIVLCGNTVMLHFATGLSPAGLAAVPFTPASLFREPAGYALTGFAAEVFLCPAVSGFVGGDTTAAALACGLPGKGSRLLLDIGTNGELALSHAGRLTCCAAAAGPAFEGGQIACGMTCSPGAVTAVRLREGRPDLTVEGGGRPTGICGSGLLSLTAELLRAGEIDPSGRLLPPGEAPAPLAKYLSGTAEGVRFSLTPEIFLTAGDVRELQLAKAAIRAGAELLLRRAGLAADGLGALLLAGGFGSRLDPADALTVGLLPPVPAERIVSVGNAAAAGAALALFPAPRAALSALCRAFSYTELSADPEFMEEFISQMQF